MLPEAFLTRMKAQLGEEFDAYIKSLERPRAVALRFNPRKGPRPELPFVGRPVPWEPDGYYYDPDFRPGTHIFHEAGVYYLQEASAMAPVALLDPKPGERICDLCAAPGGKFMFYLLFTHVLLRSKKSPAPCPAVPGIF